MSLNRFIANTLAVTAFCAPLLLPQAGYADPPAHAPAHGWRKKNDPNYVGYTGKKWERDYGIVEGRCNREAVGAVLGGAVGAAIGSQVGKDENRAVAIVAGTVIGAVIGAKIGRDIDDSDRGCMGHALELAVDGKAVSWSNPKTGASYVVTPAKGSKSSSGGCRDFKMVVKVSGHSETVNEKACRSSDGVWRIKA